MCPELFETFSSNSREQHFNFDIFLMTRLVAPDPSRSSTLCFPKAGRAVPSENQRTVCFSASFLFFIETVMMMVFCSPSFKLLSTAAAATSGPWFSVVGVVNVSVVNSRKEGGYYFVRLPEMGGTNNVFIFSPES